MYTDILILAGGSGERLWPASTEKKPKQFMRFSVERTPAEEMSHKEKTLSTYLKYSYSFLQRALDLANAIPDVNNIYIITRNSWVHSVVEQVAEISRTIDKSERTHETKPHTIAEKVKTRTIADKVLVMGEPFGRNTAPAIMWLCHYIKSLDRKDGKGNPIPTRVLMMASDHIIEPKNIFVEDALCALNLTENNKLVAFGIPPRKPETGYGYIQTESSQDAFQKNNVQKISTKPTKIISFKEKPNVQTAAAYIESGNYFWNSGLYAFRTDFMIAELTKHSPKIVKAWEQLGTHPRIQTEYQSGVGVLVYYEKLEEAYNLSPSISIDYAVSEKTKEAICVPARFNWDDVGTWDTFVKYESNTEKQTGTEPVTDRQNIGDTQQSVFVQSENCFVRSELPVALCGVEDLIVVIENGCVLVCKKGESNLVKDALGKIKDIKK